MIAMNGTVDFGKEIQDFRERGVDLYPSKVKIAIPEAEEAIKKGLRYYLQDKAVWLPQYSKIAEWLSDNNGYGMLLYGNCGLGKTLILGKIVPILVKHYHRIVVTITDALHVNADIDKYKSKKALFVDDIGVEGISVVYGEKRLAFAEIMDAAERNGNLVLATTNLTLDELAQKYGDRTMDRIVATMKCIKITGKSLR